MSLTYDKLMDLVNEKGDLTLLKRTEDNRIYISSLYLADELKIDEYNSFYWSEVNEIAGADKISKEEALDATLGMIKLYIMSADDYADKTEFMKECLETIPNLEELYAQATPRREFYSEVVAFGEGVADKHYFFI